MGLRIIQRFSRVGSVIIDLLKSRQMYFALSRTPHGIIDLAAPCFAALAVNGTFPPLAIVVLGLITVFSGYTAVYAVNDIVDYRVDRERRSVVERNAPLQHSHDLDAVWMRHPLAEGVLNLRQAVAWACFWGGIAMVGAWLLHPVCLMLFVAGVLLETLYCKLLKVTAYRTLVSGVVKTIGSLAAVFAVENHPPIGYVICLFLFLFFWEIGAQNIPNDWSDIEEDRRIGAKTFPVVFGTERSAVVVFLSCGVALVFQTLTLANSRASFPVVVKILCALAGLWFVLMPAARLLLRQRPSDAMALFNSGSWYPLTLLLIVVGSLLAGQ